MSSATLNQDQVARSLSNLAMDAAKSKGSKLKAKTKEVAESWEDESDSSNSGADQRTPAVKSPLIPAAPPSTPFSPNHRSTIPGWSDAGRAQSASPLAGEAVKRPEKTDAVARRMIAAGLGLKAPRQTDEQKAYQKSIREQESKRKAQERAEEQRKLDDAEKAKAAVWDD